MSKQTITYLSPLDAIIAVVKRLSLYENQHKLDSEEFFHQYRQGKTSDEIEFIEWANDYQHYLALRQEIEQDQRPKCIGMGDSGMTNLSERVDELLYADHQAPSPIKKRRVGILKGTFVLPLPDDFDEPLEDFQEYS